VTTLIDDEPEKPNAKHRVFPPTIGRRPDFLENSVTDQMFRRHTHDMTALPKNEMMRVANGVGTGDLGEQSLIDQAAAGSLTAFEQIVRIHQPTVRLFLTRFVKCTATADDLAQEVFVVAFQNLSEFEHAAKLSTWLLGIARNKALTHLRNEIRRRKREKQFFEMDLARRQFLKLDSRQADDFEQNVAALRSCLQQLPANSRRLIDAFYYCKQTSDSIAADNQQKPGAVRMKIMRIRQTLQKCISKKLDNIR
jgi:RNA polymerase sigma-70 factor (ECF subfamily)